jgi:hypothetical protein
VELARKVARMWEELLSDPREAADAWRRVLRMKAGDPDATEGLERAKANMLRRPEPSSQVDVSAPRVPDTAGRSTPVPQAEIAPIREERTDRPAFAFPEAEPEAAAEPMAAANVSQTPVPGDDEPQREDRDTTPNEPKTKKRKSKRPRATDEHAMGGAEAGSEVQQKQEVTVVGPPPLALQLESRNEPAPDEVEVVLADDLAEMIEIEDASAEPEEPAKAQPGNGKRSIPPPLPRG